MSEVEDHITEKEKEFARKVLSYLGRSKSEKQILVYSIKHIETLQFIEENKFNVDYTPSIFGEAIHFVENQKSAKFKDITAEDLANCMKENMEELINNRKKKEDELKERKDAKKKEIYENEGKKAVLFAKIALWVGVILVLAPFFLHGFKFGWFWYLVIVGVAFFCLLLYGTNGRQKGDYSFAKSTFVGFFIVGFIMYLWGPLSPSYKSSSSSSSYSSGDSKWVDMTGEYGSEIEERYCSKCGRKYKAQRRQGENICGKCWERRQIHQDVMKDRQEYGY